MFNHRPPVNRPPIILVEPNPATQEKMIALLEADGFQVIVIPTLEAAITQGFWNGLHSQLMIVSEKLEMTN
jgi:hypothetical protein